MPKTYVQWCQCWASSNKLLFLCVSNIDKNSREQSSAIPMMINISSRFTILPCEKTIKQCLATMEISAIQCFHRIFDISLRGVKYVYQ